MSCVIPRWLLCDIVLNVQALTEDKTNDTKGSFLRKCSMYFLICSLDKEYQMTICMGYLNVN